MGRPLQGAFSLKHNKTTASRSVGRFNKAALSTLPFRQRVSPLQRIAHLENVAGEMPLNRQQHFDMLYSSGARWANFGALTHQNPHKPHETQDGPASLKELRIMKYGNGLKRTLWLTCTVGLMAAWAVSPASTLAAERVVLAEEFSNLG
jgi:hypothetical protein